MADNSNSSLFDKMKGLPEMVANQVTGDYARVAQNRADREAIIARENSSDALTPSQKEQLSYISNAEDAQRFVDASMLGNENGDYTAGQSIYKESLKSSAGAWGGLAVNAAELYAGGALTKGIFSLGSKVFGSAARGAQAAERIEPTMGKAFDSEYAAAQRAKRAQESIARNQENGGYWKNKIGKGTGGSTNTAAKPEQIANQERRAAQTEELELRADQSRNPFRNRMESEPVKAETPKKSIFDSPISKAIAGLTAWGGGSFEFFKHKDDMLNWGNEKVQESSLPQGVKDVAKETLLGKPQENGEEGSDAVEKLGAGLFGASVATGNPFAGVKGLVSGVGSLFPSRNSAESTLSSMPSGGDSGITGEGHFEEGGLGGNTVLEVLNKIYRVLTTTKNITEDIAKNVSMLTRAQSQQDASRDLMSSNLIARENEGGSASIINSGGGGWEDSGSSSSSRKSKEEDSGIINSLISAAGKTKDFVKKWKFPAAVAGGVAASMFFGKDANANVKDPTATAFKQGQGNQSNIPVDISSVEDEYMKNIALIESGGKVDARPSTSSAQGLWQFTAGTWKDTVAAMGKNYSLADRNDPKKAEEVMKFFTAKNQQIFKQKTGRMPTNKELYMSHFLGATGASHFANADQNAFAANVNPSAAKSNYNIFYDKKTGRKRTVAEVTNIMGGRYDEGVAALHSGKWGKHGIPDTIRNIGSTEASSPTEKQTAQIQQNNNETKAPPVSPASDEKGIIEKFTEKFDYAPKKTASPLVIEISEVDRQKAALQEERNKLAKLSPSNEKDMAAQLDRLNDINTEMVALNQRRNEVTGSAEYQASLENRKAAGTQQVAMRQQQPSMTQQLQGPKSPAGVGKVVPKVRNDDPTLFLVEQTNLWSTNTHSA